MFKPISELASTNTVGAAAVAAVEGAGDAVVGATVAGVVGIVATGVESIVGEARREEIARMLAGETISEEARAAAERLIKGAA